MEFNQNDIKIDTFHPTQPIDANTQAIGVIATHIPTGIAAESAEYDNFEDNKTDAITALKQEIEAMQPTKPKNLLQLCKAKGLPNASYVAELIMEVDGDAEYERVSRWLRRLAYTKPRLLNIILDGAKSELDRS